MTLAAVRGVLQAFAEAKLALQEVVEYQPEIAFGVGRELKMEGHGRNASGPPRRVSYAV